MAHPTTLNGMSPGTALRVCASGLVSGYADSGPAALRAVMRGMRTSTDQFGCLTAVWCGKCGIRQLEEEVNVHRTGRTLLELWEQRWPRLRPIGHELRDAEFDRWIRFHSLPGSKRYADNDAEYAEILHRHNTVLNELAAQQPTTTPDQVLVLTVAWSDGPDVPDREAKVAAAMPLAEHWTSVLRERDEDGYESWTHLFLSGSQIGSQPLNRLLLLVADDETADVIITDTELNWLYHPYDGGGDVIASSSRHRDMLRARHTQWLSSHPLGM